MFSASSPLRPENLNLMILVVVAVSGAGWSSAYLLIIRRTHLDRVPGMPLFSLCFNTMWEIIFSVLPTYAGPALWMIRGWALLDLLMFAQGLLYGRAALRWRLSPAAFYSAMSSVFLGCGLLILWTTLKLGDHRGILSAFCDNIVMSLLFILMLRRRGSSQGQSLWIGIAKLIGTLAQSVLFLTRYPDAWVLWLLCSVILGLDAAYLLLLRRQLQREGIRAWRRW